MPSVTDLVSPEAVKKLSIPSNFRLGSLIAKEGAVEFIEFSPLKIQAKVSGPGISKRTVEMKATISGLEYHCTCSKKQDWFCKHCVAIGLLIWEKAPNVKIQNAGKLDPV